MSTPLVPGCALLLALQSVQVGAYHAQSRSPSPTIICSPAGRFYETPPGRPICNAGLVLRPQDWLAGDTHAHVQRCLSGVELPVEGEALSLARRGLSVSNMLIWGSPFTTVQEYLQQYVPWVTGAEDPSTLGDPATYLQVGVELSGFHASNLGHVIGLNVTAAEADVFLGLGCPYDDGSGDYAAPILDHFRGAPGAVTGYAHVAWPVDLTVQRAGPSSGGWNWESPALPAFVGADARCSFGRNMVFPAPSDFHFQPFLAAFDVALGKVDFLETIDLQFDFGELFGMGVEERWFGLYYKLLGAGLQVGISGGSDTDCYTAACDPRVWVLGDTSSGVDYEAWLEGLAEGRATLSAGPHQMLELTVEGSPVGETLLLPSNGPPLDVRATYTVLADAPLDEAIEILVDGEVAATLPLVGIGSGTYELAFQLPRTESTWIVARTASYGTHTAAVYVLLDGEPIVDCETAEYWTIFADYVTWLIDVAEQGGFAEPLVGCSAAEIRAHVAAGRALFAALRDYDAPLPTGVRRAGLATPAEEGPPAMVLDGPLTSGAPFRVRVFNAPRSSPGLLLIGPRSRRVPWQSPGGAAIHVGTETGFQGVTLLPVVANEAGLVEVELGTLSAAPGEVWYAQFYFPGLPLNAGAQDSASACLRLEVQ